MRDALDVVRIAGDERDDPARQKRGDDASGAPAPIVAAENRALDLERVHEIKKVHAEGRLLARARRLGLEEPRRTVAAQVGNDHPRPGLSKDRRGLIIGMGVVREAVPHDARPAGRGSIFQVRDGKNAGVDRLDGCRHVSLSSLRPRLARRSCAVGDRARNGLTPPFAFSSVIAFSIRGGRVAKLIVPLALEGGQT